MWHIRYPLADGAKTADGKDYLVVATTRPETCWAILAWLLTPEDPSFAKRPIGKYVILPLVNRRIPIVGDEHMLTWKKLCGNLRRTTLTIYEVGKRHALPMIGNKPADGDIRESARCSTPETADQPLTSEIPCRVPNFRAFAARKAVIAAVDALGLLEEIKPHDLTIRPAFVAA